MQTIALLGATGSIGTSALDVISRRLERYRVKALTCAHNVRKLADLAARWRPAVVAVAHKENYAALKEAMTDAGAIGIEILAGSEAIADIAGEAGIDTVLQAVVGAAGVAPTFRAAQAGKRILLANKESVVCGGETLMALARRTGAKILPVDSEHNAVFQCLEGSDETARKNVRLWLTCSGGPFHAHPEMDLESVTPEQALAHPTWSMGRKISIDSATLMNKGLEVIEAHHLFGVASERIGVVIHPQSVMHSMVEYADGSVLAQLASTDMRLPIAYCLGYPERLEVGVRKLDFASAMSLTFTPPDLKRFPQLGLAYEALRMGGTGTIVLNAANEVGVEAFLAGAIGFCDIARLCRAMLESAGGERCETLEAIQAADRAARRTARDWVAARQA
ncbi:MAG: 1-deoxy-D-xylulose-5-phosphate reductoisomerase [Duodenibacillus sp.]